MHFTKRQTIPKSELSSPAVIHSPPSSVEPKLLTKVLGSTQVSFGMLKHIQNTSSCCGGAK